MFLCIIRGMLAAESPQTRRSTRTLWLAAILALPPATWAAEEPPHTLVQSGMQTADSTREYVSQRFVGFVGYVDRFFGNERNFQETNQSVLQLDLNELMQPGGSRQAQLALKAKLRLPATEERLHLLLESNPERNTGGADGATQPKPLGQLSTPDNYSVAVRYEKEQENVWHYSSDFGVKVRLPVQPFARARLSYAASLDGWRMKTTQSLFWFNQSGAGETTQLDFEHALGEPALFRATSTATWMHMLQRFDLRQDFSVYHTLDEQRALLYEASAIGVSHPQSQVNDYVLSLRYRQQLNRRWLFLEINPQLHFPKENSYRSTPLLLLRLETLFDKL